MAAAIEARVRGDRSGSVPPITAALVPTLDTKALSSSRMVTTAVPSAIVARTGEESVRMKFSVPSSRLSFVIHTVTVALLCPAAMVTDWLTVL